MMIFLLAQYSDIFSAVSVSTQSYALLRLFIQYKLSRMFYEPFKKVTKYDIVVFMNRRNEALSTPLIIIFFTGWSIVSGNDVSGLHKLVYCIPADSTRLLGFHTQ